METAPVTAPTVPHPLSVGAVARLAAWLGTVGFGGSFAVIAQLERTLVRDRAWLSESECLEAIQVAQSMPGASGANVFTQLGLKAGGIPGAALATAAFLLPSALLMAAFGAFYPELRGFKSVEAAMAGMNPAMVAIVAWVAWKLGRGARKRWQVIVAIATMAAIELEWVTVLEAVLLAAFGGALVAGYRATVEARTRSIAFVPLALSGLLPKLAAVFLRLGAITFGGGLAMIPLLDHELVLRFHWLSQTEFSDAVTLGLITPGPVAILATFVGYRVAGPPGAVVATVATFLPAFVATLAAARSIAAFRSSSLVSAILTALAPVVAGTVAAASLSLGRSSIQSWSDGLIGAGSLLALALWDLPPLAVLAAAAVVRLVASRFA